MKLFGGVTGLPRSRYRIGTTGTKIIFLTAEGSKCETGRPDPPAVLSAPREEKLELGTG